MKYLGKVLAVAIPLMVKKPHFLTSIAKRILHTYTVATYWLMVEYLQTVRILCSDKR